MPEQFKIDFVIIIRMLLKARLKKPKRLAGLYALVSPLIWLYNGFLTFLTDRLYELARTSQVVHITAVLNDRYDAGLRRIYLVDANGIDPVIIYRVVEGKAPVYIYTDAEGEPAPYLYTNDELNGITVDFIIKIPYFIVFDEAELRAIVDKYRLPGKVYIIETFV